MFIPGLSRYGRPLEFVESLLPLIGTTPDRFCEADELSNRLQADRLIAQIREEADPASANGKKLFAKLGKLGHGRHAEDPRSARLGRQAPDGRVRRAPEQPHQRQDPAADHSRPRRRRSTHVSRARPGRSRATRRYNVNRLVDLLGEDDYSKAAIVEVLQAHKDRLNVRQLLGQIYFLQPSEKAAVFKLIDEITTEEMVPDLLARMDGKDPLVKTHLINVLARFDRPDVNQGAAGGAARQQQARARRGARRHRPLEDERSTSPRSSGLLLDPDLDVMNKAVDVIIQLNHPETAKYLIEALKAENEFSRRSAVEILNAIGTTHSVKYLLEAVADEDWWVRSRASDALARIGGPRVVDAVLDLIKDKDENIRRAAIEILNTCRDKRAVDRLIEATRDKDWWVSERAADALAEIGDAKALPALLEMMAQEQSLAARRDRGGRQARHPQDPRQDAAVLAAPGERSPRRRDQRRRAARGRAAGRSRAALSAAERTRRRRDRARAVTKALQKLDGRLSPSGRFSGTGTLGRLRRRELDDTAADGTAAAGARHPRRAPTAAATPAATSTARTLLVEGPEDAVAEPPPPEAPSFDLSALQNGDMIEGRYKFIQKIGKGAFGTVVLVEDTVVEERLILKFLNANVSSDEEMLKRFVHELRYSRRITHKNVIRIYDFLYVGGSYAISMEYFPSHTLGTEIANEKPMPPKKAVGYGTDICIGMSVAHQQGIIHRDLKPANILINDTGLLKIVDFGVAAAAKSGDTQLTKTGYVIGSPKYMAPEQILGKKVDERADIYSLGVIMYEMLAGNPPYSRGDHMSVMYQHVQGKAQPLQRSEPEGSARDRRRRDEDHAGRQAETLRVDGRAARRARSGRRGGQVDDHGTYRRVPEARPRARAAPTSISPSAFRRCCACTATSCRSSSATSATPSSKATSTRS